MSISDYLDGKCNKKIAFATYTQEVYTIYNNNDMLMLKNAPVISLSALEYRAGTPSSPSWTAFTANEYELSSDGKAGIVRVYGRVPRGVNVVRATYTAGYKIDFDNVTDPELHTLPFDITDLAERLVTKRFKRRDAEGKLTETFNGGTTNWEDLLTGDDQDIIARYTRVPTFV